MSTVELLAPILAGGVRNTYFFNGRLLTAEDLRTEQDAQRLQRQQLGRAIGEGVIQGLAVTLVASGAGTAAPVVGLSAGLGLNRKGQVLALPNDVQVTLVRTGDRVDQGAGLFAECEPPETTTVGTGAGVYVLALAPASGFEGRAPASGLGDAGVGAGCGSRYAVEGVRVRLVRLEVADALLNDEPRRRNRLAHACFGTEALLRFPETPFEPPTAYGAVDQLRQAGSLTDCDLALAVVCWQPTGIQFTDAWPVRRRLVQPLASVPWALHVGQRRLAEAEAIFLQFQEQLADVVRETAQPAALRATDRFAYLPAAGYLPTGAGGVSVARFFEGLELDRVPVDVAFLRLLLEQSWFVEPIDLAAPPRLRLYEAPEAADYVVFARAERVPPPTGPGPTGPTGPAGPTAPTTGRIDVDVISDLDVIGDIAGGAAAPGARLPRPIRFDLDLKVWAEDPLGNRYDARPIWTGVTPDLGGGRRILFPGGSTRFAIDALPPNTYRVEVRQLGYRPASQEHAVAAGQTVLARFRLVPVKSGDTGGGRPPVGHPGKWLDPKWFEKIVVVDPRPHWPWPPPEWTGRPNVGDPPPEVVDWLHDWSGYLGKAHPAVPFDPGDVAIAIHAAHTPDQIPDGPYAYAVFGTAGGAYVPVVLTPTDHTLDHPVVVGESRPAGIGDAGLEALKGVGVDDLDVLAAGWKGLVGNALGVSADTAASIIAETRDKVNALKGTVQVFGGVSADLATALVNQRIDSPVALANADPAALATSLQAQGVTPAFARRLVDEAQAAVPASAWALDAPQLGLKAQEVAALQALGIQTQGTLKSRAADVGVKSQIAQALGLGAVDAVDAITNAINIPSGADVRAQRAAVAPSTSLLGVSGATAQALADRGVGTVLDLARLEPAQIAAAFGGDVARATSVVDAARARARAAGLLA